ncbi:Mitochondrial beta-keto-acyl synthase [Xylographa carneopallida]|nr:Mitochondrial beta-keto-acyl synthase [Xylographa carneopallida]
MIETALSLELQHALARKAHIYAHLVSYATTSDAYHITHPPADGSGAYRAMRRALSSAQIAPSKVDYINAHATSTPLGDSAENAAIATLMMGEGGLEKGREQEVCVSSVKGALGHMLGGAGAVEAVTSVLAVRDNIVPPTLNLTAPDTSEFNFNYVPLMAQHKKVDVVLTNSFGFGGTNACLCFKRFG